MSRLVFDITIRNNPAQPLARHSLVAENSAYFFAGVLGVPLIYDVAKRSEVVAHLVVAVHAVIDGDKADSHLWKTNFCIKPYFQIVAAKTGHILDNYRPNESSFNISKHFLKSGPVEVRAGKSVIFVNLVLYYTVVFAIFSEDFDLVGDAVAVALVFIVAGESAI